MAMTDEQLTDLLVRAFNDHDDDALLQYAREGPPQTTLSLALGTIYDLYLKATRRNHAVEAVLPRVRKLNAAATLARRRAGPDQRSIDLNTLKTLRYAGCLCAVTGAGLTMDAGGPLLSWSGLVKTLLNHGLAHGFDVVVTRPTLRLSDLIAGTADTNVGVRAFTAAESQTARLIVSAIDRGDADTELLMKGAELCFRTAGQRLFADVTRLIYESAPGPGAIHEAIADLAKRIQLIPKGSGAAFGWSGLITYNFDDLLGEALDARNIPRAAFALVGQTTLEVKGAPNRAARALGEKGDLVKIVHLHGYTPRDYFRITDVRFVFSTSQYLALYKTGDRPMIDSVFEQFLANPGQVALYIGCSFADEAMNRLLKDAYARLPGRKHFALLQWPGGRSYAEASADEIEEQSERYEIIGVQPIWFDRFSEIPALLRQLE